MALPYSFYLFMYLVPKPRNGCRTLEMKLLRGRLNLDLSWGRGGRGWWLPWVTAAAVGWDGYTPTPGPEWCFSESQETPLGRDGDAGFQEGPGRGRGSTAAPAVHPGSATSCVSPHFSLVA